MIEGNHYLLESESPRDPVDENQYNGQY